MLLDFDVTGPDVAEGPDDGPHGSLRVRAVNGFVFVARVNDNPYPAASWQDAKQILRGGGVADVGALARISAVENGPPRICSGQSRWTIRVASWQCQIRAM